MEVVRYRPGEAIRWLQTGAERIRNVAGAKGKGLVRQTGADQKGLSDNLKTAAGAVFDFGKSAYADVIHQQAEASEFVLLENHFDIVRAGNIKSVPYTRVKAIRFSGDKATLALEKGHVTIKPVAHIVAGRIKVPVGWTRNGMEVPFELLVEELSARCKVDIDEE